MMCLSSVTNAMSCPPPPPPWMPAYLPSPSPPAYYNQSLNSVAHAPQMDLMMENWCDEDYELCGLENELWCDELEEDEEWYDMKKKSNKWLEEDTPMDMIDSCLSKSEEKCEIKVLIFIIFIYHNFRKHRIR